MTRPIRLAYVIDKLHRAGAQVHLGRLVARLDREAFQPEVVCLLEGGPIADDLRALGVPVQVMGLGRLYGPRGLAGVPLLAHRLRRRAVDVLHTYLIGANVYGTLAGRLARVPAVVSSRRDTGFSRNWRLGLVEEWLVNPAVDRVVAVSPAVAACAVRERGLSAGRVVTIENAVDVAALEAAAASRDAVRREWGLAEDAPAVGVVGHLSPVKGQADFLKAAARVAASAPGARFFLIGAGRLRGALEAQAVRLGIRDRVVFTGVRDDVPRLLPMLDVVAVPSHTEGLSNALLEAMALGRPVVATAVGGNVDVLDGGQGGRLVPPRDPPAMAAAVLDLLSDPEGAAALGAAGRRLVAERFTEERMVGRYQDLYRSLVAA